MNRIGLIGFGYVGGSTTMSLSDLGHQAFVNAIDARVIGSSGHGLSPKVVLSGFLQSVVVNGRNVLALGAWMRSGFIDRGVSR
jgi:hypothetical protein